MAQLLWDQVGQRIYETGDKNVALYVYNATPSSPDGGISGTTTHYPLGVAWNGITAITESPSGAEATDLWADDTKYATMRSAEQFGGTIEAYTYPDEWEECDGSKTFNGVTIGQQSRKAFGLAYITTVGNDTELNDYGEKIHLIYGATASPSERSYATINDSPEAITFSWEFETTPLEVTYGTENLKKVSCITISERKVCFNADGTANAGGRAKWNAFKAILFGSGSTPGTNVPHLPEPSDVLAFFGATVAFEYKEVEIEPDHWDTTYYQHFTKDANDNYNQIGVLSAVPKFTSSDTTSGRGAYIGPYYTESLDDGQD